MTLPTRCAECGEADNVGTQITVYVNSHGEPNSLIFTFTCFRCNHQWTVTTYDFKIDEDY